MIEVPFLRTQSDLADDVESRIRDTSNDRWQRQEVYRAINDALDRWGNKVKSPHLYTIPGGWVAGVYEYVLPDYVNPPFDVETQRILPKYLGSGVTTFDDTTYTWVPIAGWTVEPNATGGHLLRLAYSPDTYDGRVVWWGENGRVPVVSPTLNANIDADDTSLTLATKPTNIGTSGYIKINSEWVFYAGVTEAASTLTLTNLVRGINGTTAAAHTSGDTVYWGVATHRADLLQQLQYQTYANLHALYLTDASPAEAEHHQYQVRYYQQLADEFWRTYVPPRPPRMMLSRLGVGEYY